MRILRVTLLSLAAVGTLALPCNTKWGQAYAQAEQQESSIEENTADVLLISALPESSAGTVSHQGPWPEKLELTDEQMEQLISEKSDFELGTAQARAELKADMKKMMLLLTASKVDKQAVLDLNEKMDKIKASLSEAKVNHMLKAMDTFTAKQKEQIRHHLLVRSLSHGGMLGGKMYHRGGPHHGPSHHAV